MRCKTLCRVKDEPEVMGPQAAPAILLILLLVLAANSGCSIRKYAINKLGDAFAKSGTAFASDDDPDLIEDAVPFSLKLIEGLLAESPRHRGLLFAASSGFTQYSYAFVHQKADEMEDRDLARATALRRRARRRAPSCPESLQPFWASRSSRL